MQISVVVSISFSILIAAGPAQAQEKLPVNPPQHPLQISTPENSNLSELCMKLAVAVFRRAGFTVSPGFLPAKRSLRETVAGRRDAEACRIHTVGKKFPSLHRVEPPITTMDNYAWFATNKADTLRFDNIKDYHVGILSGIVRTEKLTRNMKRNIVASTPQLLKMLSGGRIDAVILAEVTGAITIHREFQPADFVRSASPLTSDPLFIYLFERHAKLAPKLARTIQIMQNDGSLEQIKQTYIASGLPGSAGSKS